MAYLAFFMASAFFAVFGWWLHLSVNMWATPHWGSREHRFLVIQYLGILLILCLGSALLADLGGATGVQRTSGLLYSLPSIVFGYVGRSIVYKRKQN